MPRYVIFLNNLLTNKWKLEELTLVMLRLESSTILQNKLPRELKNPETFIISCLIGTLVDEKVLVDFNACINVIPYKIFKRLGLGEP